MMTTTTITNGLGMTEEEIAIALETKFGTVENFMQVVERDLETLERDPDVIAFDIEGESERRQEQSGRAE